MKPKRTKKHKHSLDLIDFVLDVRMRQEIMIKGCAKTVTNNAMATGLAFDAICRREKL